MLLEQLWLPLLGRIVFWIISKAAEKAIDCVVCGATVDPDAPVKPDCCNDCYCGLRRLFGMDK